MAVAASPGSVPGTPRPGRLPGCAGTTAAGILLGPPRPGRVTACGRHAAYISLSGSSEVALAICTSDAVRVPFGVRLGIPAARSPLGRLRPGDPVTAGYRALSAGGLQVTVARWRAARPAVTPVADTDLASWEAALRRAHAEHPRAPGLGAGDAEVLRFAAALAGRDAPQAVAAARRLIGRGPGSTPSGDDIVGSALAAMCALAPAHQAAAALWDACGMPLAAMVTADARDRTTPVSAALLRCAARGEPIGEIGDLLVRAAGAHRDASQARAAAVRLLAVGHSSGADCLHGLVTVAAALGAAVRGRTRRVGAPYGE